MFPRAACRKTQKLLLGYVSDSVATFAVMGCVTLTLTHPKEHLLCFIWSKIAVRDLHEIIDPKNVVAGVVHRNIFGLSISIIFSLEFPKF